MHTWPEAARLCPIKGLYPDKYVLFGQKMAVCLGRLYERTHRVGVVRDRNILLQLVAALRRPLELKYSCIKQSSWRIAIEVRKFTLYTIILSFESLKVSYGYQEQLGKISFYLSCVLSLICLYVNLRKSLQRIFVSCV